jgi:hypothetical protein
MEAEVAAHPRYSWGCREKPLAGPGLPSSPAGSLALALGSWGPWCARVLLPGAPGQRWWLRPVELSLRLPGPTHGEHQQPDEILWTIPNMLSVTELVISQFWATARLKPTFTSKVNTASTPINLDGSVFGSSSFQLCWQYLSPKLVFYSCHHSCFSLQLVSLWSEICSGDKRQVKVTHHY